MASSNRQSVTVSTLVDKFYNGLISIKVLAINTQNPRRIAVADSTGWTRAFVPQSLVDRFAVGKSLAIKTFAFSERQMVVKANSWVYLASAVTVPQAIIADCLANFNRPLYPVVAIETALASRARTKLSIRGSVVTNQSVRTVNVKGEATAVKEIEVQDDSGTIFATLWREAAQTVPTETGQDILLKDVSVFYSDYRKQNTLSINSADNVEIITGGNGARNIKIIGLKNETIDEQLELLCEIGDSHKQLTISKGTFLTFANVEGAEEVGDILKVLPLEAVANLDGDVILSLQK